MGEGKGQKVSIIGMNHLIEIEGVPSVRKVLHNIISDFMLTRHVIHVIDENKNLLYAHS